MDQVIVIECEHKFIYRDTARSDAYEGFNSHYLRVDYFFCEKCLKITESKQETRSRDCPPWYYAKRD